MPDRYGPYRTLRYRLEIDGVNVAGFAEASLAEHETDVITYSTGTVGPTQKLWGPTAYGELELKRGVTREMELFEWREQARTGDMDEARRAIAVVIVDESGETGSTPRWEFTDAWCKSYESPDLDADGSDVAVESLTIVHERVKRVQ